MTLSVQPDFRLHFTELFRDALRVLEPLNLVTIIDFTRPKQVTHGDYSCNLAMHLAKSMHKNPRDVATLLINAMPTSPYLEKIEIGGAGFINLFLKISVKQQFLCYVLEDGEKFGQSKLGLGKKIQVEFVSANPTGPLHVGHGRGAAFGASLANILTAVGFSVTREYYVNDAGRQMDILALSTWLRYLELNGLNVAFPSNAYQGEYVCDMAKLICKEHQNRYFHQPSLLPENISQDNAEEEVDAEAQLDKLIIEAKKLLGKDYAYIQNFVLAKQLQDGCNDLMEFGVIFDTWFSEQSLFQSGAVARAIQLLEQKNHLYQKDGAKWFRSTDFGDEKDRVVQRENGQFTYFASDIAYHINKFERGFDRIIDVWGADHHGYIPRVMGAILALEFDAKKLEIALVQFAVLYRNGVKTSMSTRSGEFVTLRELRQEVGNDAARFFYV